MHSIIMPILKASDSENLSFGALSRFILFGGNRLFLLQNADSHRFAVIGIDDLKMIVIFLDLIPES